MREKRSEDQFRATLVCIDEYQNRIPKGRLINASRNDTIPFCGVMQFLREMEKMLDDMRFPEPFSKMRRFQAEQTERPDGETAPLSDTGRIATFNLKILFRQNASWQGNLSWLEGRESETYRSVLELLLLIDSALDTDMTS